MMSKLIQLLKDELHVAYSPAYTAFPGLAEKNTNYTPKTFYLRLRDVDFGSTEVYNEIGASTIWHNTTNVEEKGWAIVLMGGSGEHLGIMEFVDEQGVKPDFSEFMIGNLTKPAACHVPGSLTPEVEFMPTEEFMGDIYELVDGINAALFEEHFRQTKSFRGLETVLVRSGVLLWQVPGSKALRNENRAVVFEMHVSAWESAISNLAVDEFVSEAQSSPEFRADAEEHEDA
jgi:hypothetical protein